MTELGQQVDSVQSTVAAVEERVDVVQGGMLCTLSYVLQNNMNLNVICEKFSQPNIYLFSPHVSICNNN